MCVFFFFYFYFGFESNLNLNSCPLGQKLNSGLACLNSGEHVRSFPLLLIMVLVQRRNRKERKSLLLEWELEEKKACCGFSFDTEEIGARDEGDWDC